MRWRKHCCLGKTRIIKYSEYVLVALVIRHAKRMRPVISWPMALSDSTSFFHVIPQKNNIFGKKNIKSKICVFIFSTTLVWNIFHSRKNSVRHYHKCASFFMLSALYSCHVVIKFWFSRQIFEKSSNIKFQHIPSSGSQFIACGQTDMMKLISNFHNFSKAPEKK